MPDMTPVKEGALAEGQRLAHARAFYMEAFAEGRPAEAVKAHVGDRFTQHGTDIKDGAAGFIAFATAFVQRNPKRQIEIARAWEDGQYVFLHVYQNLNDGEHEYVTTAFFDTDDDGKLIEYWNVTGDFKGPNPSGRTQVDGATAFSDLDRTADNKAIVQAMVRECLFPGARPDDVGKFFAQEYRQHNPGIGDGLEIVRELSQAETPPLTYDEIVLTVGKGNFVAILCKSNWEGAPLAQVDILRLEGGKITEHWDLTEPLTWG